MNAQKIAKDKNERGIRPRHHSIIGYTDTDMLEFGKYVSGLCEEDVYRMLIKFLIETQDNIPEFNCSDEDDLLNF